MRKTLAVLSIAAVTTLTGCATQNTDTVSAYHTVARAMPAYSDMPDSQLDKAGKAICKVFDADKTTGWAASVKVISETSDPAQANVFVQAAVAAYCPQYKTDIPADAK